VVAIVGGYMSLAVSYQRKPQYNVNPTRWWVKDGSALSSLLSNFHNTYTAVVWIMAPAVTAVITCPSVLVARPALAEFFWGRLPGDAINDALAAFLAPTGFVYAILFAYAYQNAITKKIEVRKEKLPV
jgi:hypothetical protein